MKKVLLFILSFYFVLNSYSYCQEFSVDQLGNIWFRESGGAGEANYWVDQLGITKDPNKMVDAVNHYYKNCPKGTPMRWGDAWLSKFVASLLAIRSYEIWHNLNDITKQDIVRILVDAVDERTFRIDSSCGADPWNSCSEDFISFLVLVARVKNFFPQVVDIVGMDYINRLEIKYLGLSFSSENGYYSLVYDQTVDGNHFLMRNHGEQSAVYTGLLLIYMNLAMSAYQISQNPVPDYYRDPHLLDKIRDIFMWMQSVSTSDGSSFLFNCLNYQGNLVYCGDANVGNAIPRVIPAGRLIFNIFGDSFFNSNPGYNYRLFDSSYAAGNISNKGRQADYNLDNIEWEFVKWELKAPKRRLGRSKNDP
jgi:hypothetical protein